MNSEAISIATQKAIAPTALHDCRLGMAKPIVVMFPLIAHYSFTVAPLIAPTIAILLKTASDQTGMPL